MLQHVAGMHNTCHAYGIRSCQMRYTELKLHPVIPFLENEGKHEVQMGDTYNPACLMVLCRIDTFLLHSSSFTADGHLNVIR